MIDALTWKRVFLLFVLGVMLMTLLVGFENRNNIVNYMINGRTVEDLSAPWEVSDKSKDELKKLVNNQELIGTALLTEVNLKKNRKNVKYFSAQDESFRDEMTRVISSLLPQPFFSDEAANNQQMLDVLGNKFACYRIEDTDLAAYFPNIQKKYPQVCRLAVPPFAGEFAGYVTLLMTRKPSATEIESLKIEVSRISIELYLRDIDKKTR